jgi:hypothetical protein
MQSIKFEELYRAYHDFSAFRPPVAYTITIKKFYNMLQMYTWTI